MDTLYWEVINEIFFIGDPPDTDFSGYPVEAGYRISVRILNSAFKCLVKYEIKEDIRSI
jgi:hypothetical protein